MQELDSFVTGTVGEGGDAQAAPATQVQTQEQPPSQPPDAEELVNRLVTERIGNLDELVTRRVQSELAKRKNAAQKALAERERAINWMAETNEWDDQTKQQHLNTAKAEYQKQVRIWEDEDAASNPVGSQTQQPPTQTAGQMGYTPPPVLQAAPVVDRSQIVAYLSSQGLGESDLDIKRFEGRRADEPGAYDEFIAAVARAKEKRAAASPTRQVVQQFGGTAPAVATGAARPPNPIADENDPDALWQMAWKK